MSTVFAATRPRLAAGVLLAAAAFSVSACTRVVEQPPAPVVTVSAPPLPARAVKPARPRPAWNSSSYGSGASAGPRAPQAPARLPAGPTPEEEEAKRTMTLQREKLQKVLDDALPTLTSCWGGETALTANIAFEVTGTGKAENVRMPGASPTAARCVAERLGRLPLPTYTGPVLSIQIPVTVTSKVEPRPGTAAPGQVAAAPETAPPPPPKLFVNP